MRRLCHGKTPLSSIYAKLNKRHKRDREDLSIVNRLSEKLNAEAADVLGYQAEM
jgi:hypothetical protein